MHNRWRGLHSKRAAFLRDHRSHERQACIGMMRGHCRSFCRSEIPRNEVAQSEL